jgi:hypothetical protein
MPNLRSSRERSLLVRESVMRRNMCSCVLELLPPVLLVLVLPVSIMLLGDRMLRAPLPTKGGVVVTHACVVVANRQHDSMVMARDINLQVVVMVAVSLVYLV